MLIALLGRGSKEVGRQVGLAYALNTLGAIAGSLAGGFGLLRVLGAPGAWRSVVVALAVLGLSSQALRLRSLREWARAVPSLGAASFALLLLLATGPTAAWRHNPIGTGRAKEHETTRNGLRNVLQEVRRTIEWEAEGVESSIGVSNSSGYSFLINGKSDGHARGDAGTQILGGLVGAILHPQVTRSLVIGLGTGSTAGWLAAVPSMEKVEVVELEPAILQFARMCGPVNQRVLDNPKVHLTIGDAREVLLTTPERFDLIFSEPSNPYRAGIASLYTGEFYRAVRSRLEEGGIFLQWLQAYEVDGQTIQTAFATLGSTFSSVEVWLTLPSDLLVACSQRPFEHDAAFLRERIRQEPFRSALLHVWRADDLEGLLAHFVARPEFIRAIAARREIPRNTDDLNVLEFGFARTVGNCSYFKVSELLTLARQRAENRPPVRGEIDWSALEERRFSMGVLFYWQSFEAPASFDPGARTRTHAKMEYARENLTAAAGIWRLQERDPADPVELELLAEGLAEGLAELGDEAAPKWIAPVALPRAHRGGRVPRPPEAAEGTAGGGGGPPREGVPGLPDRPLAGSQDAPPGDQPGRRGRRPEPGRASFRRARGALLRPPHERGAALEEAPAGEHGRREELRRADPEGARGVRAERALGERLPHPALWLLQRPPRPPRGRRRSRPGRLPGERIDPPLRRPPAEGPGAVSRGSGPGGGSGERQPADARVGKFSTGRLNGVAPLIEEERYRRRRS